MVAGISGTGAGSGAAEGEDDENEGRLMLLHAPRKTASIAAIPRLAAVRTPPDPTMFIPKQIRGPPRPAAKRKNPDLATTSCKIRRRIDVVSQSIPYELHQAINRVCLTGPPRGHIPRRTIGTLNARLPRTRWAVFRIRAVFLANFGSKSTSEPGFQRNRHG